MFEKIREWIFQRNLKKQAPRHTQFPHYDQIRSVLILYQSDILEKNPAIKALRNDLLKDNKEAVLWGYAEKKEINSPILPQSRILGQKDFTFWGSPTDSILDDLRRQHYDLLIDLTQTDCQALRYISLYADADFKTGRNNGYGLYDFMIETPINDNPTFLFEQITHYLSSIKSRD